jgi:hypothetical protein
MEHLLLCPEAQQQTGTTQQPATTTLQQLVIHKNTNLTPAKVAQMPKGRYNYTSRMLLAI